MLFQNPHLEFLLGIWIFEIKIQLSLAPGCVLDIPRESLFHPARSKTFFTFTMYILSQGSTFLHIFHRKRKLFTCKSTIYCGQFPLATVRRWQNRAEMKRKSFSRAIFLEPGDDHHYYHLITIIIIIITIVIIIITIITIIVIIKFIVVVSNVK